MKYVIMDVESTDMSSRAEVIQIAGVVCDAEFNPLKIFNEYTMTTEPISIRAKAKHGIDAKNLADLSSEVFLESKIINLPLFTSGTNVVFIEYNRPFDQNMINQTLDNNGADKIDFGTELLYLPTKDTGKRHNYCALKALKMANDLPYKPTLHQLGMKSIDEKKVADSLADYCKKNGMAYLESTTYHNALFDAYVTYLLLKDRRYRLYGEL